MWYLPVPKESSLIQLMCFACTSFQGVKWNWKISHLSHLQCVEITVVGSIHLGFHHLSLFNHSICWGLLIQPFQQMVTELNIWFPIPTETTLIPPHAYLLRVSLLLMALQAIGAAWVVEQPVSSLVWYHPRLRFILRRFTKVGFSKPEFKT